MHPHQQRRGEGYTLKIAETLKNRLLLKDKRPYYDRIDGKNVLYQKDFYCWDDTYLGKRDCCFNHAIGLPEKDGVPKPLFDYELNIFELWERNQWIWIKKATGLGISELFLRLMIWLAVRNEELADCQMCIVTGPNVDLAKKLIKRLKTLLQDFQGILERETEYALEINRCLIQAYPSHNLGSYRSLTAVKFIFIDEGDFFPAGQLQDVRHVAERYIAKSNPWIIMVSTPNKPGGLFEQIENEPEETCLYKRIYLPYTTGLNKIYTVEEIDRAKRSPSFEREYNLQYGYGLGNFCLPTEIDNALSKRYDPEKINHSCAISMGIDPGFGSSKFGFCVLMLEDDILKVVYAKEFDRPKYEDMLNLAVHLRGLYNPQHIYVDGAKPDFIKSLKVQVREPSDYEKVMAQATHDKVDFEYRMKVIPVNFNEWGRELIGKCQNVLSKGWIAIDKVQHKELVIQMRMAKVKENGNLDKDEVGNVTYDVFDAFRLAMKMFNLPRA
jgi:hypothetical protein